jgi:hypothetical protein
MHGAGNKILGGRYSDPRISCACPTTGTFLEFERKASPGRPPTLVVRRTEHDALLVLPSREAIPRALRKTPPQGEMVVLLDQWRLVYIHISKPPPNLCSSFLRSRRARTKFRCILFHVVIARIGRPIINVDMGYGPLFDV